MMKNSTYTGCSDTNLNLEEPAPPADTSPDSGSSGWIFEYVGC